MFSPSWYNMREYFLKALKWSDNVISHKNNKYVISGGFFLFFFVFPLTWLFKRLPLHMINETQLVTKSKIINKNIFEPAQLGLNKMYYFCIINEVWFLFILIFNSSECSFEGCFMPGVKIFSEWLNFFRKKKKTRSKRVSICGRHRQCYPLCSCG